jgi:hypothetical protein
VPDDLAMAVQERLRVFPMTLAEANATVAKWHRHHKPVVGHRFSIGALADDRIIGAVIVGRPVARMTDQYRVAEVTRLVTDGTRNACSLLYGAAARAAEAMGFDAIQTFILDTEPGISLRASGWVRIADSAGGDWNRASTKEHKQWLFDDYNRTDQPMVPKVKYERRFRHV